MENDHLQSESNEVLTDVVERDINVDAKVVYEDGIPVSVSFRYYDQEEIAFSSFPVDPDFDTNLIYGGLMTWHGRYTHIADGLKLTAVKLGDKWYRV